MPNLPKIVTPEYFLLNGIRDYLKEVQGNLDSIQNIVRDLEFKLGPGVEDENEGVINRLSEIKKAVVFNRSDEKKKPRKKMSAAARRAVSLRMKRYWAERRRSRQQK
jgi:hypothetical protein